MNTNRKILTSSILALYLFSPINVCANEKNGIEEAKKSAITFSLIQNNNKDINKDKIPVKIQTSKEALDMDISLLSKESGFSEETVREVMKFQESFGVYADKILERYSNKVASVYVEEFPSKVGHINFIGEVPKALNRMIEKMGQEGQIILMGGAKFSLNENFKRAELVSEALSNKKIYNTAVFFDQTKNIIQVEIKLPKKDKAPSMTNIIEAVTQHFSKLNLIEKIKDINENDLNLKIIRGTGDILTNEYTRGGAKLYDDGTFECTLGWSVRETTGSKRYGYITAKHCSGINQHKDHNNNGTYSSSWTKNASGQVDVEFHETPTSGELDDFHANSSSIRDVKDTRSTNSMVGNRVCVYGRSSNSRNCSHTVKAVDVTVTVSNGTKSKHLARTDKHTTIGGDSGGGWSWNNTAWGVHKGGGNGKSYFTPVRVAESYTNVTILK